MRKVKLQMQVSLDGFVGGPKGELDWMTGNWDDELKDYVWQLTHPIDCILLGRKMAEDFIPYWKGVTKDPQHPEVQAAHKFTHTPKIVFSKTLERSKWENTRIAHDVKAEIGSMKKQPGGDIIIYGGAETVAHCIKEKLIDELNLFINPIAIGQGLSIFNTLNQKQPLRLLQSKQFTCGIVLLKYAPLTNQ